jgi:hypothetical protein
MLIFCLYTGNDFSEEHVPLIVSLLESSSNLRELHMDDITIEPQFAALFAKAIETGNHKLETLSMCSCELNTVSVVAIAK